MKIYAKIAIYIFLILPCGLSFALDKDNPLHEGKHLTSFTLLDGKDEVTFPDDFAGKPFALYFGNLTCNDDGFQFLSWGGAFTISLRQSEDILHDIYFAGVASLKNRPLYWIPVMVKKTINGEMTKNDVRGEMFYDFKGEISTKLKINTGDVRAIVVDKKGVIRKSFDCSVYGLSDEEKAELYQLFIELITECGDER